MLANEIKLDKWQEEFINTKGDKILCTGRQVGKSVICSIDASQYALNNGKKTILMIAPTERQAFALYEKTLNWLLDNYPKMIIVKGADKPTQTRFKLKNGTVIYCLPTGMSGVGIRFLTVDRLYVDEASRITPSVWTAVTPMLLITGGDSIYLSTPFGQQGEFWECWRNADGAYDSFTRFSIDSEKVITERPIFLSWTEVRRERALRKIEQAKKRMSNNEFAQEYLGKFVEDLFRWFSDAWIDGVCTLKRRGMIYKNESTMHFMGVDIARMGEDEGVIAIGDRQTDVIYQVENIITKKKLTTETEDLIRSQARLYDCKKVYIDAGAGTLGVSIFDHLLQTELKKKVVAVNNAKRIIEYNPSGEPTMVKLTKEDLYDNLRALGEQNRIKLLDDEAIKESLMSVQYEYVKKEGQPTRLRIFGNYTHIAEALTRLGYCVKEKINKFQILYF